MFHSKDITELQDKKELSHFKNDKLLFKKYIRACWQVVKMHISSTTKGSDNTPNECLYFYYSNFHNSFNKLKISITPIYSLSRSDTTETALLFLLYFMLYL